MPTKTPLSIYRSITLLLTMGLYSCALTPTYYKAHQSDPTYLQEKEVLRKSMNNKLPCPESNLGTFLWETKTPSKECLYLNLNANNGTITGSDVTVLQSLPEGFILNLPYQECSRYGCTNKIAPNLIFLHRTNENEELIDNKKLSELYPWDFYEYSGPYSYQSGVGIKTVSSFRRISFDSINNKQKDFKKYTVWLEIYDKMGAWKNLRNLEEKIEEKQKNH